MALPSSSLSGSDIVEAAIKAYVAAINAMEWELSATDGSRDGRPKELDSV